MSKKPILPPSPTELAAVRLPKKLRAAAKEKAKSEDITFSQLMRRALRKELSVLI
jgi:predicted HicB family RNase H-like nuclease